ncbi:MAG: polyprenyl synthetase family protein [Nanohaloarchaea archaeon]|nr:polyprenyl synthetase family protein [Candidatus Nanohaloarchaea archaeon]
MVGDYVINSSSLSEKMDERIIDISTAPSKHARDIYTVLWSRALDSNYSDNQHVTLGASNQSHHNISVILDDLQDGDETRRGVTTFHNSDFLDGFDDMREELTMNEVTKMMSMPYAMIPRSNLPERDKSYLTENLATSVGYLVNGQTEDLAGPSMLDFRDEEVVIAYNGSEKAPVPWYEGMADLKTGTLFKAGARSGAISAGHREKDDNNEYQLAEDHAYHLGLLLQVTDDILDVTQTDEELGKDALSDLVEGKPAITVIYGLENTEDYEWRRLREVVEAEEPNAQNLEEARDILIDSGAVDDAYDLAKEHRDSANDVLDKVGIEYPEWEEDLRKLSGMVYERSR